MTTADQIVSLRELHARVMFTSDLCEVKGIDYQFKAKDGRLIGISDSDDPAIMELSAVLFTRLPDLLDRLEFLESKLREHGVEI